MPEIITDDITTGALNGTGFFDVLMRAVDEHIESEYSKKHISSGEYAQVYLGAMQSVIAQSIAFTLGKSQALLTDSQIALTEQQILASAQDVLLKKQQVLNLIKEGDLLDKQQDKIDAEISLLQQKRETERAQVEGNAGSGSVIAAQIKLYDRQADGYTRDAEQKAVKQMVDTWNVRRTTDPELTSGNSTNHLDDVTVGKAVTKLLSGVGVST